MCGAESSDVFEDFFGGLVSQACAFGHHAMDKATDDFGHFRILVFKPGWGVMDVLQGDLSGCGAAKRGFTAEQLVAGDAEAVDVGTRIQFSSLHLLGAHVKWRAHGDAGCAITGFT